MLEHIFRNLLHSPYAKNDKADPEKVRQTLYTFSSSLIPEIKLVLIKPPPLKCVGEGLTNHLL